MSMTTGCSGSGAKGQMKAGFARVKITPPIGTPMTGFGSRDMDPAGCKGVHDNLFVNALYLRQREEEMLKIALPGLRKIPGIQVLASNIDDRIGVLKVSQKNHSVAKLLYMPNNDGKIPLNHKSFFKAKVLYDKYWNYKSFVANNFGGQRRIFQERKVPFGFSDFLQCIENSYFILSDGSIGKIEDVRANGKAS